MLDRLNRFFECLPLPTAYPQRLTVICLRNIKLKGGKRWEKSFNSGFEGMVLKQGSSVNVKFARPGFQREMGEVALLFAGVHGMMDHAI